MAGTESHSPRLADFLPYQLSVASNAVSSRIAEQYRARFGLKVPEWRVMAILGDAGELTQRELVGATLMDKVAVNRACKVLEERGLATRRPNEQDGRSHHLGLSDSGREMYSEIMPIAKTMEAELFSCFDVEEIARLRDFLARIRESTGDFDPDGLLDDPGAN